MSDLLTSAWIEPVATVLGALGVWLIVRQSMWNFPVGLVQVTLSGLVFYHSRFYGEVKLQVLYFVVLCYGWVHWARGERRKKGSLTELAEVVSGVRPALPVTVLGWGWRIGYVLAGTVATIIWGTHMLRHTDAAAPYRDAFITCFSVVFTWLQARKKLENWVGWIVVDAVAGVTYLMSGLYWFGGLYLFFCVLAARGHFEWLRSYRKNAVRRL